MPVGGIVLFERTLDCSLFREMLFKGAALLEKNKQTVDAMNVFPVPDGDTGTNMSMTMQRAVSEIKQLNPDTIGGIASALATGALKGARGNSGVILSQIFRGFSKALKGVTDVIDAEMLANALKTGTTAAYKAVMKPKEGTILTVARQIAESVEKAAAGGANVYGLIDIMLESGETALKKTPEMLSVLKEAGVVDAGGLGLLLIYRGFKMAIDGEELDENINDILSFSETAEESDAAPEDVSEIKYGYCTEFFIIHLLESTHSAEIEKFRDKLMKIGDSVVAAENSDMIKVQLNTDSPGKAIQFALRLGEVDKIKIENMREQNREITAQLKASEKEIGVVAVSVGKGIDEAFQSLGVAQLISGGQTMNPSIGVIAQAVKKVNARNVILLPNNPNIILAAQQAAEICSCNLIVIPSKTIIQGISAMMSYNPDASAESNSEAMTEALKNVTSASVTFAVRDTSYNGNTIKENDIIGLIDGDIKFVGKTVEEVSEKLISGMLDKNGGDGVITLYYGENCSEEEAAALADKMSKSYPQAEFFVQKGGQPLYYYYISAE